MNIYPNHRINRLLAAIFLSVQILSASDIPNGPLYFLPRAQQTNLARDLVVRWYPFPGEKIENPLRATGAFTYAHSIKSTRLAQAFFGVPNLVISGSLVKGRDDTDLLADTFGLSQEFQSVVSVKPVITNATFLSVFQLDRLGKCERFLLTLQLPLVLTNYNLHMGESILPTSKNALFPALYMGEGEVQPRSSFLQALSTDQPFGVVAPLTFDKLGNTHRKVALAEVRFECGYYFVKTPRQTFLLQAIISAPTGNTQKNKELFQPIIGNGRHWEAGASFLYTELIKKQFASFWLSAAANVTSLFSNHQQRTFDFINGFATRYLLLKEFNNGTPTGSAIPAADATTLDCTIRNNVQLDFALLLTCERNNKTYTLGYNGWLKSRDIIKITESIAENKYAIKGIQNMFTSEGPSTVTESTETIFGEPFDTQSIVADKTTVFVKNADLNPKSAAVPFQLTNKIFVAFSWRTCSFCEKYQIRFASGGAIEFEGRNLERGVPPSKIALSQCELYLSLTVTL
jgi:hypothetical protein